MAEIVSVEVIYALPTGHECILLRLPAGSTAAQAVAASGLPKKFPEIDLARNKLGIFGRLAKGDTLLRDRDRVEIYRPLLADPKEVRRRRAARARTHGT